LVQQQKSNEDLVATTRPDLGSYYLDEEVGSIDQIDIDTIVHSNKKIWLIIDSNSGLHPTKQEWIQKNSKLIDVLDVNLPGKSLDVRVYLYDPIESTELLLGFD
jgi:hypothetical protein